MTATPSARPTTAPTPEHTKRGSAKPKYVPGTPRWAQLAAHAVPLVVLPSSIWRLLLTAGVSGADQSANPGYQSRLSDYLYVLVLSVVSEGLALLTLGLVKPWGEVVPRWIPLLGGRRVAIKAAVVPATVGATLLALLVAYFFLNPVLFHIHFTPSIGAEGTATSHLEVSGWSQALFAACYMPLIAWPVLLGAATHAYHRRRTTAEGR